MQKNSPDENARLPQLVSRLLEAGRQENELLDALTLAAKNGDCAKVCESAMALAEIRDGHSTVSMARISTTEQADDNRGDAPRQKAAIATLNERLSQDCVSDVR